MSSSSSKGLPSFEWMQLKEPIDLSYYNEQPLTSGQFHSHAFYEIYYFHEGCCTYLIGDSVFTLKPGDLLLMNGLTLHCPSVEPDSRYVRSILHFDPAWVCKGLSESAKTILLDPFDTLRNHRMTLTGTNREEFEALLADIHRLSASTTHYRQERMTLRIQELMYVIAGWCQAAVQGQDSISEKERHVQHVVSFVEENYMHDLTLERIARDMHITKHYLSSLFKEVTGTTVFKYLYHRRINQAKILLRLHPYLSITEVSQASGFKHLAHFSRMFKSMVGTTPEHYRRSGDELSLT
ncbi:AraC family transcriptional regulator [Paenibacillus glucanolyticus]|jgi:AraC-like DNA-binding protein|uniref:AraC family transcriptional regulator n=1 Tax=Paenibacillus TaxID=44249 RepID=UPI0003E229C1|nr:MULTISPECIES: helix-turn-helix domain-containing protein [Paenibacillus]ANA81589.1 AraC family transcriptional regulator [Paenibacillus glucanolyticus]AVV59680.1 AraC family transcriptional regulator [Paenibacillus glucanolyticus]ETT30377.1 AraC family transcriptional regulator [Paenibacillus sp. FSL R5-808]MPY19552.1 AraC family transcriptional regulator [Paenibacillus glucanolyticus]